jgi:hypothetical protein
MALAISSIVAPCGLTLFLFDLFYNSAFSVASAL